MATQMQRRRNSNGNNGRGKGEGRGGKDSGRADRDIVVLYGIMMRRLPYDFRRNPRRSTWERGERGESYYLLHS